MNIIIVNVKENKTKSMRVKTVKNRGFEFVVVFNDGTSKRYSFKDYDFFIQRGWEYENFK